MSETAKLMNFDEFRTSCDARDDVKPFVEAVRQQRDYLRDTAAAEAVLKPGAISALGWPEWPSVAPAAG